MGEGPAREEIQGLAGLPPHERNAVLLRWQRSGMFDFVDIGTHRGGGIRWGGTLGGLQGLGIEVNERRATRALRDGYAVLTGTLDLLPPDSPHFRFAVCRHVLEHFPARQPVVETLATLTELCDQFIYVEQPVFDYENSLEQRGLTMAHLTMTAHTYRPSIDELLGVLEEVGITRYLQGWLRPIRNSSHRWVHAAPAAPNRSKREAGIDPDPPAAEFDPPLYRDLVVIGALNGADLDGVAARVEGLIVERVAS